MEVAKVAGDDCGSDFKGDRGDAKIVVPGIELELSQRIAPIERGTVTTMNRESTEGGSGLRYPIIDRGSTVVCL